MTPKTMSRVELMSELHAVAGRRATITFRDHRSFSGTVELCPARKPRYVALRNGPHGEFVHYPIELVDFVEPASNPCDCDAI